MSSDEQESGAGVIIAERCPICGTLMTDEQAGPIHFANPTHSLVLPGLNVGAGQSVTRLRCENGHTFWSIEDEEETDER